MKKPPDFFLTTAGDSVILENPRACWVESRLKDVTRDDHALIKIEPELIGQNYGLGSRDIKSLILSARYENASIFQLKGWPVHVYVSRILDESIIRTLTFTRDQIEIIAWGMIFRGFDEASIHKKKYAILECFRQKASRNPCAKHPVPR